MADDKINKHDRILQLRDAFMWTKDMLYKFKVLVDTEDLDKMPMIHGESEMARCHQKFLDAKKAKLDAILGKNRRKRK